MRRERFLGGILSLNLSIWNTLVVVNIDCSFVVCARHGGPHVIVSDAAAAAADSVADDDDPLP